jgi:hypothetical protein
MKDTAIPGRAGECPTTPALARLTEEIKALKTQVVRDAHILADIGERLAQGSTRHQKLVLKRFPNFVHGLLESKALRKGDCHLIFLRLDVLPSRTIASLYSG